jgi:hypothetical protein
LDSVLSVESSNSFLYHFSAVSGASLSEGADSSGSALLQEAGGAKKRRDAPVKQTITET